ncbi:MAG: alpha/beta hydrolase [Deltaproteobacteria bacterium]|nr:alpha/beta hydrolase [Deltaproteobacteria bacterium]
MNVTRVFIHGLESSSQGTKGVYFQHRYPDMIVEDYPGSFDERMIKLNRLLSGEKDLILVGSSYGGLMASVFTCTNEERVTKLILLAPALNLEEFGPYLDKKIVVPVVVYHGKNDDVVPVAPVQDIARTVFANISYHVIDDDHSLHSNFPSLDWDTLLDSGGN